MRNLIFAPYPYQYTFNRLPQISLLVFIVGFLFVYIFRPFNVYFPEHKFNYLYISLIQSSTSSLIFFTYFSLFNLFSGKNKLGAGWCLYKEILLVLFWCMFSGTRAFFIRELIYNNPNNFSWRYLFEEISHSFLIIGGFIGIYTIINYSRHTLLNKKEALTFRNNLSRNYSELPESFKVIHIEAKVKKDNFDLNLNRFVIAKADGNYVEFYMENSKGIDKKIVRLSLKNLDDQLKSYKFIIRTHRTFIVNTRKIRKVSGNALGYVLHFDQIDFQIPVARGKIKEFNLTRTRN